MKPYENKNIKLLNLNNSSLGEFYTFDELLYTDEGQEILKNAHEFKMKLVCICNGENNPIPMTNCIMPSRKGYYLRRNKGTQEQHNRNCPLYSINNSDIIESTTKKKTSTDASISFNKSGKLNVVIKSNGLIDNISKAKENSAVMHSETTDAKKRYRSNAYSTIYGIGDIILSQAWNQYVTDYKNKRNPKAGNLFYVIYNNDINFIIKTPLGNSPLKKIMFTPFTKDRDSDISKLAYNSVHCIYNKISNDAVKGCNTYILGSVGKDLYDIEQIGDYIKVKVYDPFLKNYYYIYVTYNYYLSIRNKTRKVIGAEYYISAFVRPEDDRIVVSEMAFIPVYPQYGFSVDSSKEIDFAKDRLLAKGDFKDILFIKPPRYTLIYNLFNGKNYIPDFLLLEKNTRKIATIVEIFGYYTEEYMNEQEEKIKYYNSLPDYNFIAWEVNKNRSMPYVPRIQKFKTNII